jgi:hypothetical protein
MRQLRFVNYLSEKTAAKSLFCLAAIAAAHLSYINNGFVWLDHGDIEQGRAIIPLSKWWLAFAGSFADTGFYRPMVTLLHSMDASLWGINAPGFHFTSIALHCAAAMAAPFFIGSFFPLSSRERGIITLVFGLHPVAVLPAGYISFRSETLLALFTFSAVALYGKVRSGGKAFHLLPLFFATACACFSKETAFFYLPSFFLLWEITRWLNHQPAQDKRSGGIKGFLPAVLTAAAGLGSVFCLRWGAMPVQWCITPVPMPLLESIGTRLVVLGKHLVNLVSPLLPPFSDAVSQSSILQPAALCVAITIGVVVFMTVKAGFRSPGTVTVFLFAVCLFPALDLVPLPRFYSPHYAYLAVAPLAAGVVLIARKLSGLGRQVATGSWFLVVVWIIAMGAGTIHAGKRFQSDLTLFAPEVGTDPRFSEGWFYVGNYYRVNGDLNAADTAYDNGLAPAPETVRFFDRMEFLINKSSIAVQRNDLPAADSLMLIAQACSPGALQPDIAYIRADIAARRGDYDAVIALLSSNENNLLRQEARRLLDWAVQRKNSTRHAAFLKQ